MIEGSRILPPLTETFVEVGDGGPADLELYIVPRRAVPVARVEFDGLWVTVVSGIIMAGVAQVDASYERDVALGLRRVTKDQQLLVVRTTSANSFVEQHLAPCFRYLACEPSVLLRAEGEGVAMRAPEQSSYVGAAMARTHHALSQRGSAATQSLVAVTSPVGESQFVTLLKSVEGGDQSLKVAGSINQEVHLATFSPRGVGNVVLVDGAKAIPAFVTGEEPVN